MTKEELQRIGQYSDKINGAGGSLSVLTLNESLDLEMLIKKRLDEINGEEEFAYANACL